MSPQSRRLLLPLLVAFLVLAGHSVSSAPVDEEDVSIDALVPSNPVQYTSLSKQESFLATPHGHRLLEILRCLLSVTGNIFGVISTALKVVIEAIKVVTGFIPKLVSCLWSPPNLVEKLKCNLYQLANTWCTTSTIRGLIASVRSQIEKIRLDMKACIGGNSFVPEAFLAHKNFYTAT